MLKRVPTDQVAMGMYIQKLDGFWFLHPFWKSKFLLTDPRKLADLQTSRVRTVVIDVSKGADVGGASAKGAGGIPTHRLQRIAATAEQEKIRAQEFGAAAALAKKSVKAVRRVFDDARLGKAVTVSQLRPMIDDISSSITRNPHAFTGIARMKQENEYLYMHSLSVCALMINLARQLRLPEEQERVAGLAGMLMDMGMRHVPEEILSKKGALSASEIQIRNLHTTIAHEFLGLGGDMPEQVLEVCLHHHERMDGSGYPHGLKGKEIGLFARMAAICDVYDARTSNRVYKRGEEPSLVLREMEHQPELFDPEIFQAFLRCLGIYPVGSLVRLKSQRLAVVVEQNSDDYTRPKVRAFYAIATAEHIVTEDLDLCDDRVEDQILSGDLPENWGLPNWESRCAKLLRVAFRPRA